MKQGLLLLSLGSLPSHLLHHHYQMIIVVVVILSVLRVIGCIQICCLSIFNGYVQRNPIIFAQGTLRIDP